MRVQMDRDLHGCLQPAYQMIGIERGQQASHVLNAKRVCAEILQLFREIHVSVDVVDGAHGIADRGFSMFAAPLDLTDCSVQVPHVVEGVEDAEDIDAVCGRAFDEPFQHVVGIMPIADEILPAQQHLQFRVGHGCPEGP